MALFDEGNPGKNLMNATIWLDSSKGSSDSEYSEYSRRSGGSDWTPFIVVFIAGAIFMVPFLILWFISLFL